MTDTANIPAIRFKGFSGACEESKLGDIFSFKNGASYERFIVECGAYSLITLNSINIDGCLKKEHKKINFSDKSLSRNDLIMVLSDVAHGNFLGLTAIIPADDMFVLNQRMGALKPKTSDNIAFIRAYINFNQKYFKLHGQGSSQQNLSKGSIEDFSIKLPCLEEQTKIGALFSQLDTLITQRQRKYDKLLTLKKALLSKMFPQQGETVPAIRFKGFSEAWEVKKLGDVVDVVGGGTPSTSNPDYWNGSINWYSPTEIGVHVYAFSSEKKISALGLEKSSAKILPAKKTVLFTSRAGIGDMAILMNDGATNQGFQSFVMKEGTNPYFIYSMGFLIKRYALKTASGSTFLEISSKLLRDMELNIPTAVEQTKIGALFSQLDHLISPLCQTSCRIF